jgi:hypothetical protein
LPSADLGRLKIAMSAPPQTRPFLMVI